jgi:hypothetical protein
MTGPSRKKSFENTWPMFDDGPRKAYPSDPLGAVTAVAPPSQDLLALTQEGNLPEADAAEERREKAVRASVPPPAPEWSRAARAMIMALQDIVGRGNPTPEEQATVARAWAAWTLAGKDETQILRVAHLVSRAYEALHQPLPAGQTPAAVVAAAARVLHSGLPSRLRDSMPLQRVTLVVQMLQGSTAPWPAIVEGTADLLGWKDYARSHAASVIRTVLERRYHHQPGAQSGRK